MSTTTTVAENKNKKKKNASSTLARAALAEALLNANERSVQIAADEEPSDGEKVMRYVLLNIRGALEGYMERHQGVEAAYGRGSVDAGGHMRTNCVSVRPAKKQKTEGLDGDEVVQ